MADQTPPGGPPAGEKPPDEEAATPAEPRCLTRLREALPDAVEEVEVSDGVPVVRIRAARVTEVCRFLKGDPETRMDFLADLCGVDMIAAGRPDPRFDVVYQLFSITTRQRMRLKAAVADGEEIASVTSIWRTANWHEREAFDMFGIRFAGHPDLRRILMPEEFDAHPLRKDFPLEGREKDHGSWRRPEDEERFRDL